MKPNEDAKSEDVKVDEAALKRADEILRQMLTAPPKSHEEMTAKKATKKPRK